MGTAEALKQESDGHRNVPIRRTWTGSRYTVLLEISEPMALRIGDVSHIEALQPGEAVVRRMQGARGLDCGRRRVAAVGRRHTSRQQMVVGVYRARMECDSRWHC